LIHELRFVIKWDQRRSPVTDTILIVEDDKKTASLVALYLQREGFQTVIAGDG